MALVQTFLGETYDLLADIRALRHSVLGHRMGGSAIRWLFQQRLREKWAQIRGRQLTSPQTILGKQISFQDYAIVKYLMHELFLSQSYTVNLQVDHPQILDCGSNIGLSVIYLKLLYPDARITAFEPLKASYDFLLQNIEQNGVKDTQCFNCALGPTDGTTKFYFQSDYPGSLVASTDPRRGLGAVVEVPLRRLSPYIGKTVDLLKLDIEGAEGAVMQELHLSGALKRIERIVMEYHHHIGDEPDRLASMLSLLETAGFGYLLRSKVFSLPYRDGEFQDVSIYAYRRQEAANDWQNLARSGDSLQSEETLVQEVSY